MARKAMPPKGRRGAVAPGKGKGKALVPPLKGAGAPPPRPVRGRVAVAVPVFPMGPPRRGMGPPPPGRGMPPRMTPPGPPRAPMAPETPRAERLEGASTPLPRTARGAALTMKQRGIAPTMAALRRGKLAF
jgi:hypothetical protein